MSKEIQSIQVSLIQLLTDKILGVQTIVIPIVQRDYAQGRNEENEVRNNFLQSLKSYLMDNKEESHDLDFVYGNLNPDKEFIPLDGQQRLTTLFLLHYYLSIHDGSYEDFKSVFVTPEKYSRFLYQTRLSSTDFCNALINNPITILSNEIKISEDIRNKASWFSDSWIFDPTIMSMLNMLDSIHSYFKDTYGLYNRLAATQFPAITFRVLYMSENGLTDDLYIKMNSRGLELTPFENLKAHILKRLKIESDTYELVRTKVKGTEIVSVKDYFAFKMDINWAELFWVYKKTTYRKTDNGEQYAVCDIDSGFLNFINTLVLNYKALQPDSKITYEDLAKYNELYWSYYSDVPNSFYLDMIGILDMFEQDAVLSESENAGIYDRLFGNSKFKIRSTFERFVRKDYKDAAYDEHIRLYAYYAYLIKHKENFNQEDFYQWMRIVMNLTTNHNWQNVEDFCRSMRKIQFLNENNNNGILQLMSKETQAQNTGFNPTQYREECIKASLLLREDGANWKNVIYEAENIDYLKGQIISILNFSGIELYYNEHHACDWDNADNSIYIENVKKYIHLYSFVFDENGVKRELTKDGEQLFRRALLCKGDYLIGISSNRWSMIINAHRDYSWHRYLQDENNGRRGYFKDLLDGFDARNLTFKLYLEGVIKSYTSTDEYDWKNILIKEPRIWGDFGKDYLLRFSNDDKDCNILSTTTMGGWHVELRTRNLYYQGIDDPFLEKYIKDNYCYSQSWSPAYICLKNGKDFFFSIQFTENRWKICIEKKQNSYQYTPQQIKSFEANNFIFDSSLNLFSQNVKHIDNNILKKWCQELI